MKSTANNLYFNFHKNSILADFLPANTTQNSIPPNQTSQRYRNEGSEGSNPSQLPYLSSHEMFVEWVRATYSMGVIELDITDPENDALCLALSNTLDELASLISIYDMLKEATS
jgi:hypothetical protein